MDSNDTLTRPPALEHPTSRSSPLARLCRSKIAACIALSAFALCIQSRAKLSSWTSTQPAFHLPLELRAAVPVDPVVWAPDGAIDHPMHRGRMMRQRKTKAKAAAAKLVEHPLEALANDPSESALVKKTRPTGAEGKEMEAKEQNRLSNFGEGDQTAPKRTKKHTISKKPRPTIRNDKDEIIKDQNRITAPIRHEKKPSVAKAENPVMIRADANTSVRIPGSSEWTISRDAAMATATEQSGSVESVDDALRPVVSEIERVSKGLKRDSKKKGAKTTQEAKGKCKTTPAVARVNGVPMATTRYAHKATIKNMQNRKEDGNSKLTNQSDEAKCKPLKPLRWEFQHYNKTANGSNNNASSYSEEPEEKRQPKKRLLIGMYSGFDSYASMLDITASVNKAYAKRWGHSTVVLQGVSMHLGDVDGGHNCTPKAAVRAAFNKIRLLEYALDHVDKYDQLLLVDTDAMVFDLDYDVTTLVDDDSVMLVAHRVHESEPERGNWNVNNGVTLWNLHHPETAGVAADWDWIARRNLARREGGGGDQHKMHWAIREGSDASRSAARVSGVKGTYGEFFYGHGSVIRHYIRADHDWNAPNPLDNRLKRLERSKARICERYAPSTCGSIAQVSYADDSWRGIAESTDTDSAAQTKRGLPCIYPKLGHEAKGPSTSFL